jgi:selenium-dependent xanthine dehydrogenase
MIEFILNGEKVSWDGDENLSLLNYLRNIQGLTAAKDGCSGQSACGACMVEIDGKAKLSCVTPLKKLAGCEVLTMEGLPEAIKQVLGRAYVEKGAVQCGFCTPGLIMRTKVLLAENPQPGRDEIAKAINQNLCRCTGYVKIVDAIELALKNISEGKAIENTEAGAKIGDPYPKYLAYETAVGERKFVKDLRVDGMLHAALHFSEYPRAVVKKIDTRDALSFPGVVAVYTASDVPGERNVGLIFKDWPLMIAEGEITHYIGDVIAGVVAVDEATARAAAALIRVEYEVLEAVTDVFDAVTDRIRVHADRSNVLENCIVRRGGDAGRILSQSAFVAEGKFETQRIEHAFLEPEAALAMPEGEEALLLYTQGQGIYIDRRQIASLLGIAEEKLHVVLVPTGGGFGGKEDMTVQGHTALFAWKLHRPVMLSLSREESIRMHPKRHPVWMDMKLGCDAKGRLSALYLRAHGDSGAYASVGTKVMERVAGHASGAYHFPAVDLESLTIYTNNIPSGAMRGFGANQVAFALEALIDELCMKGNFDRWKFRYDNALTEGKMTATGQILEKGVGVRACLEAVKEQFYKAKYAGLACGIKNSGVGNGMPDYSDVVIEVVAGPRVHIYHGWTEMGQGVQNIALQTLVQETGIDPSCIDVFVDTIAEIPTGMTTSSRATALLGNAIIDAAKAFRNDLAKSGLEALVGRRYKGNWICDWTTKPGADTEKVITHFAYGYAAQVVILDEQGNIEKVVAAHDAGRILNPLQFEGQVEGGVHMGLGYALTEDLPMEGGFLVSSRLRDCGVLRAKETPLIEVIGVEVADPYGPYGAKGIGEIGLVPTAAAVGNALCVYDGVRRYKLPMKRY